MPLAQCRSCCHWPGTKFYQSSFLWVESLQPNLAVPLANLDLWHPTLQNWRGPECPLRVHSLASLACKMSQWKSLQSPNPLQRSPYSAESWCFLLFCKPSSGCIAQRIGLWTWPFQPVCHQSSGIAQVLKRTKNDNSYSEGSMPAQNVGVLHGQTVLLSSCNVPAKRNFARNRGRKD